jgi:hypothetical protein
VEAKDASLRLTPARKAKAAPPPLESAEQASFIDWFEYQFPRVLIYAIPNGAFLFGDAVRRAKQMAALKRQGLRPGVPDLHIPGWGLYLEMKRSKGGVTSDDQDKMHRLLRSMGFTVLVCAGAEAARDAVMEFYRKQHAA